MVFVWGVVRTTWQGGQAVEVLDVYWGAWRSKEMEMIQNEMVNELVCFPVLSLGLVPAALQANWKGRLKQLGV